MNQRGFISSLYVYLIAVALILGLGYGLYKSVQNNGKLQSENETLIASVEAINKQLESQNEAQLKAHESKIKAERDAAKARRELTEIKVKYAELLNQLPAELINRLRNAIDKSNGDLPAPKPDRELPVT